MSWPDLLLTHDHLPWTVDASLTGLSADRVADLPWDAAFDEMEALESGAVANPDEGRQVGHYWLRDPMRAPDTDTAGAIGEAQEAVHAFVDDVRSGAVVNDAGQSFTRVLHIGIGGSALGPQLLVDALGRDAGGQPRGLPIDFLDNTDPDGIARTLGALGDELRTTLVVAVSKSGGTPEPMRGLAATWAALEALQVRPGGNCVAITGPDSKLDRRAEEQRWLARLPVWDWVGGRFSLLSAVGLLPAALAGLDTGALLEGAATMDAWTRTRDPLANPAAVLAGVWHRLGGGRGDRAMVVLPYADRLVLFSRYLQQLVMESLGKRLDRQGREVLQGLTVYGNKGSTDQHAFVQQLRDGRDDALVVFVQVLGTAAPDAPQDDGVRLGDQLQGFLLGTRRALAEIDRPSVTLTVPRVDEHVLGGLVALFERAVGLYASLVDVNAYHQPGVEAGKKAAGAILSLAETVRLQLQRRPSTALEVAVAADADAVEVLYLLRRMEAAGVARVEGAAQDGAWRLA